MHSLWKFCTCCQLTPACMFKSITLTWKKWPLDICINEIELFVILVITLPPAAPGIPKGPVRFEDLTETSVTLDWLPPRDNGGSPITHYTILMSVSGETFVEVGTSVTTKFTVKKLTTGKKHVFQIIAHNKIGKSKALESDNCIPKKKIGEFLLVTFENRC